ncbi:sensor histidine kinase [Flavobacterium sp.]|uniref:tetratricopeptide repeat-containing sensor histidine kinase n=1 Tax=Flavobacterium sp. TaxID=239 RepID=UPI0032637132
MFGLKKTALLFIWIVILFSFLACNQKKENNIVYKKPPAEKLDATCKWLKNEDNFLKKNYMSVLYHYYNQKIKQKNYILAAKSLELVAWNTGSFASFDQRFFQTVTAFSNNYTDEIPESKTRFFNMYFGDYYTDKGYFYKAIKAYAENSKIDVVDYDSCYFKGDAYRTIAWCYYRLGKQNLALKNELASLKYFEKTDSKVMLGNVYIGIAEIYQNSKDYDKTEDFLNKALAIFSKDKQNNLRSIYICLYNKINLYDRSMNYEKMNPLIDSVYFGYKKSKQNDPSIKISINTYYVHRILEQNKFAEAKAILDSLKPEVDAINSTVSSQEYTVALASLQSKQNKGIRDVKPIHDAIQELKTIQNYTRVRDLYAVLYNDAMNSKDYEKAMLYTDSMSIATDSLGTKEMAHKVAELDKKYQTKAKEQQIALQKKTIVNNRTTIALLVSALIGFLLLATAFTLIRKQKQLSKEKRSAQQYTKQLLEKTEEERKRIASDLHDSVSHELLSLKNSFEVKSEITNTKIDSIINDIRIISRNLHPVMFDKIGLKSSIEQLVERAQLVNNFLVSSHIEYNQSLSSSDELQVYRIIQEALSNIIKYANAVAAKISILENSTSLLIEIKDNGIGFNISEVLKSKNSFGLHNIIERSRAIGGEAKIVSDKKGTIITIEIKK